MNILLIEDHKLLSTSLKNELLKYPDIEEVAVIDSPISELNLFNLIEKNNFDILLLDINIKRISDSDGLILGQKILKIKPEARLLFLTGYDYYAFEKEAKNMGAFGFLNKEIETETLHQKLQEVLLGNKLFKIQEDKLTDLTPKELEIVILYAQGYSRTEVAQKLFISLRTLANHLSKIYEKLDVKNYQEMIWKATHLGYIKENILE